MRAKGKGRSAVDSLPAAANPGNMPPMSDPTDPKDPIAFELFKNAIFSIADEMALTVFRTTYSGVLKDNMDYSTGFADADGRLVAQGLTLPGHLGSMPTALESIMRHYGDDMAEGDVFIMNDPFDGGMHLPDIFVFKPLYHRGRAARLRLHRLPPHRRRRPRRRARTPRTRPRSTPEGLRIPPLKLYEAGKLNETLHDLHREERAPAGEGVRRPARAARRLPHRRAAVRRAGRAATAPTQTAAYMQRDDRLRRAPDARRARASCPTANGASRTGSTTTASTTASRSGCSSPSRKTGDHMVVDWTGTIPQVKGAINNTLSFTKAASYTRHALGPAAGHPEQRGRVPRDRGDLPAGHDRQRRAAGGLRGARPHRLPHGRLHVRRAGA